MCLVCIEYSKGKLKLNEAIRNIGEMKESVGNEHYDEVMTLLPQEALQEQQTSYYLGRDVEDYMFDDEYWEELGFGD